MPISLRAAPFVLLAFAVPAAAQNGAMWVSDRGQMMSFQFTGGSGEAPPPLDRGAAEMAAQFVTLCLENGGGGVALPGVADNAGLAAIPFTIAGSKKTEPVTLGIWRSPGTVVSMANGFLGANAAQCNVTYYVAALPDRQAVTDALSTAIGSGPSNLAAATDKKGKPKKYYTPEWTAEGGRTVTAHVAKGHQYMPGNRVQISVWTANKAGK